MTGTHKGALFGHPADEEADQHARPRHHPVQGREDRPRHELRQRRRDDDAARPHAAARRREGRPGDARRKPATPAARPRSRRRRPLRPRSRRRRPLRPRSRRRRPLLPRRSSHTRSRREDRAGTFACSARFRVFEGRSRGGREPPVERREGAAARAHLDRHRVARHGVRRESPRRSPSTARAPPSPCRPRDRPREPRGRSRRRPSARGRSRASSPRA